MKKTQLRLYLLEFILIIILFFALFAPSIFTRQVLAIVMLIYMLIVNYFLRRKKTISMYNKQVKIIMLVFALIYIVIFYLLGLYFGFEKARVLFSWKSIINYIIPLTIIIYCSESIRNRFISQKVKMDFRGKKVNLSLALTYIAMVLVDMVIYTGVYDLTRLDNFLTAIGFVLFSSMACNMFYNYVVIRFDNQGLIIYRLITVLFVYFIPFVPSLYIFFRSFLRMVYPYIMYLFMEWTFAKSSFAIAYKDKSKIFWETSLTFAFVIFVVAIVSCRFTYGMIVIGSRSMTGSLNSGDAVIYKAFKDDDKVEEGNIIVYKAREALTIHRVIEIQDYNGEVRYYTKGDANPKADEGYIHREDIVGVVKLKVKYIGYPTLYIRELFK